MKVARNRKRSRNIDRNTKPNSKENDSGKEGCHSSGDKSYSREVLTFEPTQENENKQGCSDG
jgi:hypothetical protein